MARTAEAAVNQRSYVSTHRPDYYIEAPKQLQIGAPQQQLIEGPKPDPVAQARSGFAEAQRALNKAPIDVYAGMTEGERAEAIAKWNATKLAAYQTVTSAISSTYQYLSNVAYGTPTPPTQTRAVTITPPAQTQAVTITPPTQTQAVTITPPTQTNAGRIPPNNGGPSDDRNDPPQRPPITPLIGAPDDDRKDDKNQPGAQEKKKEDELKRPSFTDLSPEKIAMLLSGCKTPAELEAFAKSGQQIDPKTLSDRMNQVVAFRAAEIASARKQGDIPVPDKDVDGIIGKYLTQNKVEVSAKLPSGAKFEINSDADRTRNPGAPVRDAMPTSQQVVDSLNDVASRLPTRNDLPSYNQAIQAMKDVYSRLPSADDARNAMREAYNKLPGRAEETPGAQTPGGQPAAPQHMTVEAGEGGHDFKKGLGFMTMGKVDEVIHKDGKTEIDYTLHGHHMDIKIDDAQGPGGHNPLSEAADTLKPGDDFSMKIQHDGKGAEVAQVEDRTTHESTLVRSTGEVEKTAQRDGPAKIDRGRE